MDVRVATYNVHGLRRPMAVARAIRLLGADVVLVQEFGWKTLLRAVARAAGMRAVGRAPALRPFQRNGVLIGRGVEVLREWPVQLASSPPRDSRGGLLVLTRIRGRDVLFASVHLGLKDAERRSHAALLADEVEFAGQPFVIGGDLNEGPDGPAARLLIERFGAGTLGTPTFPATRPTAKIDFVFGGGGARVTSEVVPPHIRARGASDHLPLVAVIDIGR